MSTNDDEHEFGMLFDDEDMDVYDMETIDEESAAAKEKAK